MGTSNYYKRISTREPGKEYSPSEESAIQGLMILGMTRAEAEVRANEQRRQDQMEREWYDSTNRRRT